MAGRQVTRQELDMRAAEAMIAVRDALRRVETIASFLANVPIGEDGVDHLTLSPDATSNPSAAPGHFGYTPEEAELIRYVVNGVRNVLAIPENQAILAAGAKMTGLD